MATAVFIETEDHFHVFSYNETLTMQEAKEQARAEAEVEECQEDWLTFMIEIS